MIRRKRVKKDSLLLASLFVSFLFVLFVVSILLKVGTLVKDSRFDSIHRFNLVLSSKDKQVTKDKQAVVISFSPATVSMSELKIAQGIPYTYVGRFLEIPIDGFVLENSTEDFSSENIADLTKSFVTRYRNLSTNLTFVDMVRLWWFSKFISFHDITTATFVADPQVSLDLAADNISSQLFGDDAIIKDKESISIRNASDLVGFGNRLARLISNIGGNVVSVETADSEAEKTQIVYSGSKSFTVKKLEKLLSVSAQQTKVNSIADITITLGKDRLSSPPF